MVLVGRFGIEDVFSASKLRARVIKIDLLRSNHSEIGEFDPASVGCIQSSIHWWD
jgi:hypothetical protein